MATTTGTIALTSRTLYWRMTISESSYNAANNTSTLSYSFEYYMSAGSGGWADGNSIMFQLGINDYKNIDNLFYVNGVEQSSITSGKTYTNSAGTMKVNYLGGGSSYRTMKYCPKGQSGENADVLGQSSGTYTITHNSDGTGTAYLQARFGMYGTGAAATNASIKTMTSDTIALTDLRRTVSYSSSGASSGSAPASQQKTIGTALTLATNSGGLAKSATSHSNNRTGQAITLSYNANGGSGAPSANSGTGVTVPGSYTRTYSFSGWATSSGGAKVYNAGGSYTTDSDITLYPAFSYSDGGTSYTATSASVTISSTKPTKANTDSNVTITVTYNANGGSGAPSASTGTAVNTTPYPFSQWAAGSTSGTRYNAGATYTESITASKTVTMYAIYSTGTTTRKSNPSITLSSTQPSRTGYTFLGWSTSSSATSASYAPGTAYTFSASTTLYAVWQINTYWNDINVYSPEGVQDFASAYFDLYVSESNKTYTDLTNENTDMTHSHGTYFDVYNIRPYYSYYEVSSVTGYDSVPSAGRYRKIFDAANEVLSVYMQYKSYYRDINAYNPGQTAQNALKFDLTIKNRAGTVVATYKDLTNEVNDSPSALTLEYGYTGTISNIRSNLAGAHYSYNNITGTAASSFTYVFDNFNNVELYTAWDAYSVSYSKGDATSGTAPSAQTKTYGVSLTLATNSGNLAHSSTSQSGTKAITVSYDANGGSSTPSSGSGNATTSATVTWTAAGWATSQGGAKAYDFGGTYSSNSAATLYPAWSKSTGTPSVVTGASITTAAAISHANESATGYSVTYDMAGGTGGPSAQTSGNRTVTYSFSKWNTNSSGTGTTYNANTSYSFSSDAKLYAIWTSTTGTTSSWSCPSTVPTKSGFDFVGWSTISTDTNPPFLPGQTYTITSGLKLYAIWKSSGSVRVNTGSEFKYGRPYVWTTKWVPGTAYVHDGSSWKKGV